MVPETRIMRVMRIWRIPLVRRSRFVMAGALVVAAPSARAQPASVLARPEAVFPSDFTSVTAVRELRDGRVIVLDYGAGLVHLVDARLSSVSPIGRHGQGPGEYRSPTRLFALRGDSTAVYDWGNTRLLVIRPDGSPGGILDARGGRGCEPWVASRATPYRATDAKGQYYTEAEPYRYPTDSARQKTDSAAIERWNTACRADTLGFVPANHYRETRPEDVDPFPAPTQWAVAPDGRVAFVRPDPYRVDIVHTTGRRQDGVAIAYDRVRVTEEVKQAWREEQERPQPALTITRAGAVSTSMMRKGFTEPSRWPASLPPFSRDAVQFASDGRLWVRRAVGPDQAPLYDVIDGSGRLVERVRLSLGSRIVGFGNGTVHVIRRDRDDLEYLERHRLP